MNSLNKIVNISTNKESHFTGANFSETFGKALPTSLDEVHKSVINYFNFIPNKEFYPQIDSIDQDRWLFTADEISERIQCWPDAHIIPHGFFSIGGDRWCTLYIVNIKNGKVYEIFSDTINDDGYLECDDFPVNYENIIEFTHESFNSIEDYLHSWYLDIQDKIKESDEHKH